ASPSTGSSGSAPQPCWAPSRWEPSRARPSMKASRNGYSRQRRRDKEQTSCRTRSSLSRHHPRLHTREADMADRALRGMRLGTQSMETAAHAELAERVEVHYDCPNGHVLTFPFSVEAEVPLSWECHCGALALLRDGEQPEAKDEKTARTHW